MEINSECYQNFFTNYPNILLLFDENAHIIHYNQKAIEAFNILAQEIKGQNLYELIPDLLIFSDEIQNKSFYYQFPSQKESSYYNLNRWLVQKVGDNEIWAVSFDENKHTEYNIEILNKLKESESKFKQLYRASPIGIAYLDLDGNILELNQKFADILDAPTMTLQPINFFAYPSIRQTFIPEIIVRTMEIGKTQRKLIKYLSEKGKTSFINIYISPLKVEENIITGILLNIEDVTAKIKMGNIVEKQMAFLDSVIEHLPMGIEIYDRKGLMQKTNPAMGKILGMADKTKLINKFNILEDPLTQASKSDLYFKKTLYTQTLQGRSIEIDFDTSANTWNTHQGKKIFHETYVPIKNREEIESIMLILEDITERTNYENKLKKSEQTFREMFINHSAVMLLIDIETEQIINANQAAEKFYGYSLSELKSLKVSNLNVLSKKEVQQEIKKANNGTQNYFNFKHHLANGNIKDVEVYSTPIIQNGKKNLFSIIHDITQRKEIEEELLKNEQKYRKLFEESGDAIFIHNLQGEIIEVNQQACEVFGYSKEELLQFKTQELYPKTVLEYVKKEKQKLVLLKRITSEKPMLHASGKRLFIEMRATILDAEKGLVQRILRDVTDRKNNEIKLQILIKQLEISKKELTKRAEELQQNKDYLEDYNQRLEKALLEQHQLKSNLKDTMGELTETQTQLIQSEKMASLGVLTSGVAHEINNPVNFIRGGIDILDEGFKLVLEVIRRYQEIENYSSQQEIVQGIEKIFALKQDLAFEDVLGSLPNSIENIKIGVDRTIDIIRHLKSFSRLDEADVKPIDIHEGLDSSLLLLNNELKYKAKIVKNYSLDLPLVECWTNQINQVFMNIIHNAAQALEEYGVITIQTKLEGTHYIQIIIEDTGVGMSEEVKKKVFEPFYTTKPVGEGNGLGMYISYKIIEKHQGYIEIESKVGKGTKFILTLPLTYTNSIPKNR